MAKPLETEKDRLEEAITLDELKSLATNSKNGKSPGPDGFISEFYKISGQKLLVKRTESMYNIQCISWNMKI